jgi:hypothetical protein
LHLLLDPAAMPALLKTWFDHARHDWRMWVVFASSITTLAATGVIYLLGWGLDPSTHFGAIFASWVSGVALFIVVGSVIALVSLARPERESFDWRARILFRRQSGKHIDYIVARIKGILEHYAERTVVRIAVQDFHAGENKFRIVSTSEITVRSYLDDVETNYRSTYDLENVTVPPASGAPNRLTYLRVDGEAQCDAQVFTTGISLPLKCIIEADSSCKVNEQVEHWLQAATEPNTEKPKRYTQLLTLSFENLTVPPHNLIIRLSRDGIRFHEYQLLPNQALPIFEIKDIGPGELAYDFRILKA